MPHLHRFYLDPRQAPLPESGGRMLLPEGEAHHALKVLRLRKGDAVALIDGCGLEARATVEDVGRREVAVLVDLLTRQPAPAPALRLAVAWLHREKAMEDVVLRGTELGVNTFVFFRSSRSDTLLRGEAKWRRWAIEACKQCGRAWLPGFEVMEGLDALGTAPGVLLAAALDGAAVPLRHALDGSPVTLVIGPEGDFTAEELRLLDEAGAKRVSFGGAVLRSEAAAALGAALIRYELGGLGPLE